MQQQSFTITNIFDWILKIFIFILPIAYFPGIGQYGFQMLIFNNMAVIMFAMTFLMNKRRSSRNYVWPVVLFFSAMVSLIKAPTALSLYLLNIIFAMMLYKSVVENVDDVEGACNFFLLCGVINILFVIPQALGHDLIYVIDKTLDWQRMLLSHAGLMSRNYHLAWFLAMCLPLAFYKNKYLGILFIVALGVQHSFAGYAGAAVGLGIYFISGRRFTKKTVLLSLLAVPVIAFVALNYDYGNLHLRTNIWLYLSKDIMVNPFWGYGLGMFNQIFLGDIISSDHHLVVISSYSQYVKQIAEHGFFPVLIICIVLGRQIKEWFAVALRDKLTKALLCGWISLLVIMIFHEVFRYTHIAIPFILLMALCEARVTQFKTKEIFDGKENQN